MLYGGRQWSASKDFGLLCSAKQFVCQLHHWSSVREYVHSGMLYKARHWCNINIDGPWSNNLPM